MYFTGCKTHSPLITRLLGTETNLNSIKGQAAAVETELHIRMHMCDREVVAGVNPQLIIIIINMYLNYFKRDKYCDLVAAKCLSLSSSSKGYPPYTKPAEELKLIFR